MQKYIITGLLTSICFHVSASVFIPTLNRPSTYRGDFKDFELWGQFDYSGRDLDFIGATNKADTSYIEKHINYSTGLNIGIYKGLHLRYQYLNSSQHAVRATKPKNIDTQYDGHDIRLEYAWKLSSIWLLSVEGGFRSHEVSPLHFLEYQSNGFTLFRADGDPIMSVNSSDTAYLFGSRLTYVMNDDFNLSLGFEARFLDVDAKFTSPALAGGFFASRLRDELPQQTPWQEQHLLITASVEWHVWKPFSVAMDFKHYQIWRKNYQPKAGKQDYNSNQQFDFYLFANVYRGLTLYGHAQIMTHYLLGEVPLTYNTRTNHRFNTVYGFLSGGLSYNF